MPVRMTELRENQSKPIHFLGWRLSEAGVWVTSFPQDAALSSSFDLFVTPVWIIRVIWYPRLSYKISRIYITDVDIINETVLTAEMIPFQIWLFFSSSNVLVLVSSTERFHFHLCIMRHVQPWICKNVIFKGAICDTSIVQSDIKAPSVCVGLLLLVYRQGQLHGLLLMDANLLFILTFGTGWPPPTPDTVPIPNK